MDGGTIGDDLSAAEELCPFRAVCKPPGGRPEGCYKAVLTHSMSPGPSRLIAECEPNSLVLDHRGKHVPLILLNYSPRNWMARPQRQRVAPAMACVKRCILARETKLMPRVVRMTTHSMVRIVTEP
jgi:hypothetical protein